MDMNNIVRLLLLDVWFYEFVEFFWIDGDEVEQLLEDIGFIDTDIDDIR